MGAYNEGDTIGRRYTVVEPISQGAMGAIYRAMDSRSGREVALKVMLEQFLDRADLLQRFEREAQAVADLHHPHIVDYYGHGQDEQGRPFLVTEFLAGMPGSKLVKRKPPLTLREVSHVISQLCSALAIAHSRGIVHRDLKWSNVMITPVAGDPLFTKLIDFGILKYSDNARPTDRKKLTRSGMLLGTPEYTSPEQILGRPLDGRSDLYSVGVMTYELLCGQRPFQASNKADLLLKHVKAPVPALEDMGLRYPLTDAFKATLYRALEKNPDDRFASVAYFSRALEAAVKDIADADAVPEGGGDGEEASPSGDGSQAGDATPSSVISWLRRKQ